MRKVHKTCCVTGHRDIPASSREYVCRELGKQMDLAIEDSFTDFISGFAEGVDLMFAQIVVDRIKAGAGIFLEAAIPYAGRLNTKDPLFQSLLAYCCRVHVTSQEYQKDCFLQRDLYMVEKSLRVIAVYDGRKRGGTFYTMNRAFAMGKEVNTIRI